MSENRLDHLEKFDDMLKNKEGIKRLIHFMVKEFSKEAMLSYIEFLQFKRFLKNDAQFIDECNKLYSQRLLGTMKVKKTKAQKKEKEKEKEMTETKQMEGKEKEKLYTSHILSVSRSDVQSSTEKSVTSLSAPSGNTGTHLTVNDAFFSLS